MFQISVEYCLFPPLISCSISHGTGIEGQGVAEVAPGVFALILCSEACYLKLEINV